MRIVLDTNLLLSSLFRKTTPPHRLIKAWHQKRFGLISSETQIEEFRQATRRPKVRGRLVRASAGELVNQLRLRATMVTPISGIDASPDPGDNFLLGMAQAGTANYLVSGDKRHVLDLKRWQGTHIVTARRMADILKLG